ncbi:SAWADEE HOMEODOMAIN HOMOLOG 1-like protein [Drosera capensis]
MDEESIRERERHQIEQIRQLKFEELQVEEVESMHGSDSDDSDPDNIAAAGHGGGFTFDAGLASLHTYLGDASLNVPLFYLEDSSEPVKVQEQCITISTQIPSPFQFNGSTHQPDASSNLVVPADESLRIKAHEQSTTQVPSSTQTHIKGCTHLPGVSEPCMTFPAACILNGAGDTNKFTKGEKFSDLSEVEFEARSSKDEAWYDVERALTHRILSSGEAEVRVRYMGYGAEEDVWVNVKNSVRERSLPVEHWECYRVNLFSASRREMIKRYTLTLVY